MRVEEIAHEDEAGLGALLAFASRHGTPRATHANGYLELMSLTEHWSAFVARDGNGGIVAAALPSVAAAIGLDQVQLNAFVVPGRQEAFDAVLGAVEEWARARGAVALTAHVSEPGEVELEAWLRAGFDQVGERSRVARAVTAADAGLAPSRIHGVSIVPVALHPELEPEADRLWRAGHEDVPSALRFDSADLPTLRQELGLEPGDPLPASILLAHEDGAGVGLAVLVRSETEPHVAGHRFTTVDRAWRARGVGRALKVELLRWAAEHGVTRLQASNDLGNEPMRAINERLGYEPEYRIVLLRRSVGGT